MAPNYIAGAPAASFGQVHGGFAHFDEFEIGHAAEGAHRVGGSGGADAAKLRAGSLFAAHPDALEQMIEANFVVKRDSVGLGGVQAEMTVRELDAAARLAGNIGIVSDHQDGVAGVMQRAKNINDDVFVGFIEISGGLIGEN